MNAKKGNVHLWGWRERSSSGVAHLRLPEELLELLLRQQPVVLHECRNLRWALRLIVNRPVNFHVAIQNGEELFFVLWHIRENKIIICKMTKKRFPWSVLWTLWVLHLPTTMRNKHPFKPKTIQKSSLNICVSNFRCILFLRLRKGL